MAYTDSASIFFFFLHLEKRYKWTQQTRTWLCINEDEMIENLKLKSRKYTEIILCHLKLFCKGHGNISVETKRIRLDLDA